MIELKDDGSAVMDFPSGPVTIKPPTWGAYKRIRAQRAKLTEEMQTALDAAEPLDPLPDAEDQSADAQITRGLLIPKYIARRDQNQEIVAGMLAKLWQFIMLDENLADPKPPTDPDDWPTELLLDAGEFEMVGDRAVRTNDTILESVLMHWGKARWRSGGTQIPGIPSQL